MSRVAIVGAAQTRFGDFPEMGIKELFSDAYQQMLQSVDKGVDPRDIKAAFIGSLSAGNGFQLGQMAPLLMGHVGLPHIPALRVENACASGGFALVTAAQAVASGRYDIVIAAGVEKMRDVSSSRGRYWLGISGDTEYERLAGLTFAGLYACMARKHMEQYGLKREHLSMVAVKNHAHGAKNPKAFFRKEITLETALNGAEVAAPLNVWDCCPTSDGAAVVLLVNEKIAHSFTDSPVYIRGMGAACDYVALHDREDLATLKATVMAAKEAYAQAGIRPQDIDFAEVHDCFTIAEILAYEDLGFCDKGQGWRLLEDGVTCLGGRIPVNVSGGLKAKGHPIAATGVGMACEIFWQLRGEAESPSRQIPNASTALSHNVGGSGGSATVIIYGRG